MKETKNYKSRYKGKKSLIEIKVKFISNFMVRYFFFVYMFVYACVVRVSTSKIFTMQKMNKRKKKQILDKYAKKSSHIKEFTEIITLKLQGRHIVLPTCHKQQRAMFHVGWHHCIFSHHQHFVPEVKKNKINMENKNMD